MRTLAVTQNITVDGSVEFLGDWFDPTQSAPDHHAEQDRQSLAEDILLLGRQTFEDFRGFWPQQTDDRTGVTAHLNRVEKLVVSSTLGDPGWEGSTVLGDDWVSVVESRKAEDGGDIVVTGSLTLCPALFEAGLVDEVRLFTYPVVQGRGRRLVPEGWERSLVLRDAQAFGDGVVLSTYDVR